MKNILNQIDRESEMTTAPVGSGNPDGAMPEFGRHYHVFELFGIKRGLLHLLVIEGKIKSVLIRRKGNVHGTRYYHLASVSAYLHAQMAEQENTPNLAGSAGSESVHKPKNQPVN
jgi:hypothetical protein